MNAQKTPLPAAPCEGTPAGRGTSTGTLAAPVTRTAGGDAGEGSPPAVRTVSPDQAAWVREHVWTAGMRKTHREVPHFYDRCACQSGLTHWCQIGQHELCHRATPLRSYETLICDHTGNGPCYFSEPYAHETDVSATGPRRERVAMVWLADRVCRWVCSCDCGHLAPAAVPEQLGLFVEVA